MKLRLMALVMAMVAGLSLHAQDKTVYVNLDTVFMNYYKTVNANIALQEQARDFQARMNLIRGELENLNKQAKTAQEEMRNDLLPEDARKASQRNFEAVLERLSAKRHEFEQSANEGRQNLERLRYKRHQDLVRELLEAVNKYADEIHATHVIEVSGKTVNEAPVFLKYPLDKEITVEILKRVNQGHEEEVKIAKAKLEAMEEKEAKAKENAGNK